MPARTTLRGVADSHEVDVAVIHKLRILPILLVLGCAEGVELSVPRGDATGSDTGASPEDGGPHGGQDSGSALEDDIPGGCTLDDLLWQVEVRLPSGSPVHRAEPTDELILVGVVHNPCDEPLDIELPGSCMVEAFDVIDLESGDGEYEGLSCLQSTRTTELAAGGTDETILPWGSMGPGVYEVTAHFAVENRRASTELIVN